MNNPFFGRSEHGSPFPAAPPSYPTPISHPPRAISRAQPSDDFSHAFATAARAPASQPAAYVEPETTYVSSSMSLQHPSSLPPLPYGPSAYPSHHPSQSLSFATSTLPSVPAPYASDAGAHYFTRPDHVTAPYQGSSFQEPRAVPPHMRTQWPAYQGSSFTEPRASRPAGPRPLPQIPVHTRSPAMAGPRVPIATSVPHSSLPNLSAYHPSWPVLPPGTLPTSSTYPQTSMPPQVPYSQPPHSGSIPGMYAAPAALSMPAAPRVYDPSGLVVYDPSTIHPDHPYHDRFSPYSVYVAYAGPPPKAPTFSGISEVPWLTERGAFAEWHKKIMHVINSAGPTLTRHLITKVPAYDPINQLML
ncbi:hypothetical protein EV121DRAFT_293382 [Schizophyllum commune]